MFDQHFVFSFYENKECVMQIDYGLLKYLWNENLKNVFSMIKSLQLFYDN
jgi:hypothetical protein